jgi:serine/threonine protein kinase
VKRTEIAVRGAPSTQTLRLELSGCPSDEGLVLELLHDDRQTGTLARVLGGRVGLGEISVPVAVKLQRDTALSQEDRGSVAAKFDKERNVHRRLQTGASLTGQERIVRQLEVWAGPADHEADSLEPCILCAHARHGLAPHCPECHDPGALLEELQLTDDRGLRCNRCNRQFWSTPKTREAILEASLGHDPACQGCAMHDRPQPEACRTSAVFLNFFRNRVLLLERLDLDLEDYLRWQRAGGPSGTRQAARQAFEAHRRQLEENRARLPGPSVRKVADLLRIADLYSDIVAGVEHLHQNGVAHLDLKPANLCLRFRGADLEVKIIDLGLSDDPNTLAYLRQAEGPLSLWTDYSAPEFRRPRSRPLPVDGRFHENFCELDWPSGAGSAPDPPCPGDLLYFEDRAVVPPRFRVVGVRPRPNGGLLVQARAEPEHRAWLGEAELLPAFGPQAQVHPGLAVVLEKHCGFAADVYSLGMLLLAMLTGQPEVGDFREALPSVAIELEDLLHDVVSLPGRALVQRLLNNPSKHLQVFHTYAQRLAAFGVAQPLAEELLGIVLRATLRGEPQVFYLTDRGADARVALGRLRADLDAVRGALRNTLIAAQATAVQESRLAVLDQLHGRLHNRQVQTSPLERAPAPGRLLYPALDLGAAGQEHRERELANLAPLASQPASVLARWERELSGTTDAGRLAERQWDFLLRYCRRIDLKDFSLSGFLGCYEGLTEKVARAHPSTDPARIEDRERVLRWLDDHQHLAARLRYGREFGGLWENFLANLRDKLLTPWERALKTSHFFFFRRRAVPVALNRVERAAISADAVEAGLEHLAEAVQKGAEVHSRRSQDFARALAQWRAWGSGRAWLDGLAQLEADALRQRRQVDDDSTSWEQEATQALQQLRRGMGRINEVFRFFDGPLAARPAPEEVVVRLTRKQREMLDFKAAAEAITWLDQNWPAPGEKVEAIFALWELGLSS